MSDSTTSNDLKTRLQPIRCIIAGLYSLLIWERIEYSLAIIAFNTLFFLLIWTSDLSILTTLSMIGLLATLFDYFAPIVSQSFLESKFWNKSNEAKYNQAIAKITKYWAMIVHGWHYWQDLKDNKPRLYFPFLFVFLFVFAWISNVINNTLLTYLITTTLFLLPGLHHHGYIKRLFRFGSDHKKSN